MAKIYAPNKQYDGVSASVSFTKGVGETENPTLITWFKEHGYTVEEEELEDEQEPPKDPDKFAGWDVDQLKAYAKEQGIDIGQASSTNGILKKIHEAEKET